MDNNSQEHGHTGSNVLRVLAGLLVGGLAGAAVMLLLAPQSGKRTRAEIQQKGIELRDQTVGTLQDTVAQVRGKARQVSAGVREKAEELQQRGQAMLGEQRKRLPMVDQAADMMAEGAPA